MSTIINVTDGVLESNRSIISRGYRQWVYPSINRICQCCKMDEI
jgi:hypothetical protein